MKVNRRGEEKKETSMLGFHAEFIGGVYNSKK